MAPMLRPGRRKLHGDQARTDGNGAPVLTERRAIGGVGRREGRGCRSRFVSESNRRSWSDKFADHRELGVKELIRFDPSADEGLPATGVRSLLVLVSLVRGPFAFGALAT
jgi:hypothetical protein